ncbi:hypothetical protein GCM10023346_03870 [Arthrobacter gyeryongensis]|uniref:Uncharacterized protein n=1 Tax=Arthrobacter gyeryongensis TaxID=1650592 RepID=A0ABP9S0J4_9MICC
MTTDHRIMVAIPVGPSGHGSAAPGSPAKNLAIAATIAALAPATAIGTIASHGSKPTRGTAMVPKIVTGATNGATAIFASNE